MAEKPGRHTLYVDSGLRQTTPNRDISHRRTSSLDLGFSPSGKLRSPVGSLEGAGLAVLLVKSPSDMSSATSFQVSADSPENVPVDSTSNDSDGRKALEGNFSTAAQHGSVDQEPTTLPVDFADGKDEQEDESQFHDTEFVDAPDQLSIMSDGRSVDNGESALYPEPHEGPEENHDVQVADDGKQVRQLTYELALLQASLEKTTEEKEAMAHQYMEEREMLGRDLANIQRQLDAMANQQLFPTDNGNGLVDRVRQEEKEYREHETHTSDTSLQVMMSDCSKSVAVLKSAVEQRLQSEGTIRELHGALFTKDQEMEGLVAKVDELSISHDVVVSYMRSLQQTLFQSLQESSDGRAERDLHHEVVMNKLLASLSSIVHQQELLDDCSVDKISLLEKNTSLMIDNYNSLLSEIDLLKQCLTEVVPEVRMSEGTEFGVVFDRVRSQLRDHKRLENDFIDKLSQVENENKKLLEELDKAKERIDVTDGEMNKIKIEMEQEKSKSATTKEKLGMAVTKGKALVQQRDSLKQSLAEKTNELEKCLLELQEKSNALESAKMRNQELINSESLAASLQDSLSQKAMTLEDIEEILSRTDRPDELHSMDITECVRWLADQKSELLGVSLEYDKLKSSLGSLNLPEVVASYKLETQISWLGESLSVAEDNMIKLQGEVISSKVAAASLESELAEAFDEIDHLKTSLSTEKREKDSLQIGLEDLSSKYEAVVEREFQVNSAKDRMTRMFLEACGVKDQGEFHDPNSDMATFIEMCVGKVKEQITTTYSESTRIGIYQFERIQSFLYVRDQEVALCMDVLEEDMFKRSELTSIANELRKASEEIVALKDEKDSLQKDLERSDEKSALLREKLSMAVKKGKGLVQEREGLRKSADEKHTEIEKLKLELQQQESVVSECRDQIKGLTSDLERLSKLESDLLVTNGQKDQLEKFLFESNSMLERVVESIEGVALPIETVFEEPVDKVKCLVDCFNEYQTGKAITDQELEKIKEEADSLSRRLTEAHTTIESLEAALSEAEKSNILSAEERNVFQISKTYLEQELEKIKEEASSHDNKFLEACAKTKSLEEALSRAEQKTSLLEEEKAAACLDKNVMEKELERVKEEVDYQAGKLAEANQTIKSLEEGLFQLEKSVSVLNEEKTVAQAGMGELEKTSDELAEAKRTIKSLEEGLFQLEKSVSVLTEEKIVAQVGMGELEKAKHELAEANQTIKSLEDGLFQLEKSVSVLTEEKNVAQAGMGELEKTKDELAEANQTIKSLEDGLFQLEKSVSFLTEEKSVAQAGMGELEKTKDELAEANQTIKSLEDGLIQLEKSVSFLTEEKNAAQARMADLERVLEKTKDEAGSQASKLADVYATVKSLQEALSVSEDNIRALTEGKENAEMEVQALNAKLFASMAELAGTHGSLTNQSAELFSDLSRLQVIMNDSKLISSLPEDFRRKFEGLRNMSFLLENIQDQFVERGSELLQTTAGTEGLNLQKDSSAANIFSAYCDKFVNGKVEIEIDATDNDDVLLYLNRIIEGFNKKNKLVGDRFEDFSSSIDELIQILLKALQSTKANVIGMLEPMELLKLDARNLGAYKQASESTMFALKKDISMLLSAWSDAAELLGLHIDNNLVDVCSESELEKLNSRLNLGTREATETAENLATEVHNQIKMLANLKDLILTAIQESQNRLKEVQLVSTNAIGERDLYQNRLSTLEDDLEVMQSLCDELKTKLKDYEAKEDRVKEKDADISLLQSSLATKEQESEGYLLSEDQIKTLFQKMNHIEILPEKSDLDKSEFHYLGPVEKLFDVIDSFPQLQHQMRLLSHDKAELQSSLAVQVDEIERLRKESESLFSSNQDLEKIKVEFMELIMDLERLIQKFGGKDVTEGRKSGLKGLISVLENLVNTSIRECETSKSKAQESGAKLHENQKVVDELSEKVKVLEDSIHSRPPLPDTVQERSIFKEPSLPTGSEISEIEDIASIGRSSMSPVPPAAHVRTLRKGSSDHLAITIDSESDRLITQHDDDDKGHAFKSLNTSGLIPKQGKLIADRIDGVWVSGGRVLMSRPRARLSIIAYCLLLHLWLLGTIL